MHKFSNLSDCFAFFDKKSHYKVSFTDFCQALDELGFKFDRELSLKIFTAMDKDCDNFL